MMASSDSLYHRLTWLIAAALIAGTCAVHGATPNIILFYVDDMGWQDTSVPFHTEPTDLNRRYRTPNMERLAASGMKFTQAYAASLCSPSRVSLMTGMNAARHKVTNWTLRKDKSPDPVHDVLAMPEWNLNGMAPEPGVPRTLHANPLPAFLKEAGYRTIHVGKAHFGAKGTPGEDPENLGFDINIAGHAPGGPGSYLGTNNFSAAWRNEDRIWDVPGLEDYHGEAIYLTEALTLESNKAIDRAVSEAVPFYLYMSHYAIHAPWEGDDRFITTYKAMGLTEREAIYASMIEGMDKSLGDLWSNLERHGIEEETIILFMSDNGQPAQVPRNRPLRGHKLTAYEGGIRVPLLVRWPGVTEPGSVQGHYVIVEDLFPTILEMAGVQDYQQVGGEIDGESFVPLLQGDSTSGERAIFWHYPHVYDQPPFSAIRKGPWKLIYYHLDQHYELYNLEADIGEQENRYEDERERASALADALGAWLKATNAQMPIRRETGTPVPLPGS